MVGQRQGKQLNRQEGEALMRRCKEVWSVINLSAEAYGAVPARLSEVNAPEPTPVNSKDYWRRRYQEPPQQVRTATLLARARIHQDGDLCLEAGHLAAVPPNVVALDCEMVGVGRNGETSRLARLSIVDHRGTVLADRLVKPLEPVTDYRTRWSGIDRELLTKEEVLSVPQAQQLAERLLYEKIVVGHALHNDFEVLNYSHPEHLIRDTQNYKPLRKGTEFRPKLKFLAQNWLKETIQDGSHDSVEDARVALRLYAMSMTAWEKEVANNTTGNVSFVTAPDVSPKG